MKLFKQLRDRMYARMLRYTDAHPNRRDRLIPMSFFQYGEWEDNARHARHDYIAGKISAEEFLRRIDTMHDLDSYDTVKQELLPEESVWQKRVAADPDFDPQRRYQPMMVLDLGVDVPQWQYLSEEELIRKDQEGHRSLREQYGKRLPVSSDEPKGK